MANIIPSNTANEFIWNVVMRQTEDSGAAQALVRNEQIRAILEAGRSPNDSV